MIKEAWKVQLKGKFKDEDYELSVIQTTNKHGQLSWGWGDESKIILFTSLTGNTYSSKNSDHAMFVANSLCKALNERDKFTEWKI